MNYLERLAHYSARIDTAANTFLSKNTGEMYEMLRYFMGYLDEAGVATEHAAGKRLRPALMLLLAEAYGVSEKAESAALSVELFHNFTLIHDDIEDHDEVRRGRPTVWKRWGVNKAINAGDVQLILAIEALRENNALAEPTYIALEKFLLTQYRKVAEGQHADFALTEEPLESPAVTEDAYLLMITNKSAALIAAVTQGAGIIAERSQAEQEALYTFGLSLGIAYQLHDDMQSIWGTELETGKTIGGDLIERKKTLPVLHAYKTLETADAEQLRQHYGHGGTDEAAEIRELLEKANAKAHLETRIQEYKEKSLAALAQTCMAEDYKAMLRGTVDVLVPNTPN